MITGDELKKFQEKMGWTQPRAAGEIGVAQSKISKWESGSRAIPLYIEKFIQCLKKNRSKTK
jgi:transcriptional regulator with XRE-family HTH domain